MKTILNLLIAAALASLASGCYTGKTSEPPRTAEELTLLSAATDEAVAREDLTWASGKKIYVEEKYFDSYDKLYVIGSIRDRLSSVGAILEKDEAKAELVVEIRSGGLGEKTGQTMFGIPAITIPIPLSGPAQTPEIDFYKSQLDDSVGKFAMLVYVRETGEHYASVPPTQGRAHYHLYKLLGFTWYRTNVPELKKHPQGPYNDLGGEPVKQENWPPIKEAPGTNSPAK
jgi:hypothetical protein